MKLILRTSSLAFLCLLAGNAAGQSTPGAARSPSELVPAGFVIIEDIRGDLNKDGLEDRILLIKATDRSKVIKDEYRGRLDRNRRGMIVAIQGDSEYRAVASNPTCFSSENEDGGVYFAPELSVTVTNGILNIHYAHGRYGYWEYKFRVQNADVELIGYEDSENQGPTVLRETSINLSTKRMLVRENMDPQAEPDGKEKFREIRKSFVLKRPISLRAIRDFDAFDLRSKLSSVRVVR